METRYLKTLVVAAESGSFSRTAEIMNLTQSAVSQRIKFLEEHFEQQLFDRSASGLVLTQIGSRVVDKARGILQKEQELLAELERFTHGKRLSIGSTPTFGTAFLPEVVNRFLLQHSDLEDLKFIFVQPAQAVRGVLEGDFDLAILEHCQDLELSGLHVCAMPEDQLVFISAPRLGLDEGMVSLTELQRQRLYVRRDGCSSKRLLQQNLTEVGSVLTAFSSVIVSDDLRLTIDSVLTGNGISFVSRNLVADKLAAGQLREHLIPEFHQSRCRSVILARHRAEDPLLQDFLGYVEQVCGSCSLDAGAIVATAG